MDLSKRTSRTHYSPSAGRFFAPYKSSRISDCAIAQLCFPMRNTHYCVRCWLLWSWRFTRYSGCSGTNKVCASRASPAVYHICTDAMNSLCGMVERNELDERTRRLYCAKWSGAMNGMYERNELTVRAGRTQ